MEEIEKFSYYKPPISNTAVLLDVDLDFVYNKVKSDALKGLTLKIRAKKASKDRVLPYVTVSGCFSKRNAGCLKSYSSLICVDLDDVPLHRKEELAGDTFLKPVMIFVSPRSQGLKMIVRVKDGSAENHSVFYQAIERYLQGAYGIIADPACKDIARATYLCWDPAVFYRNEGFVTSDALLKLIPPVKPAEASELVVHASCKGGVYNEDSSSTGAPLFGKPSTTASLRPSDFLNRDSRVHDRAVADLKADGWIKVNDELWRRPGKDGGNSAIYNLYEPEGIYFFTNYSSNSPHFGRRGYTDVQIINILEFNEDFLRCITELSEQYL